MTGAGSALTHYGYFRSSAAYRVRIALNFKGMSAAQVPVHLVRDGGEHRKDWYRALNPMMRVPALAVEHGGERHMLTQSLAIVEWLEEIAPTPPLLPADPLARAHVRAAAMLIACDIHPINNSGVLNYLRGPMAQPQDVIDRWYAHWVTNGFRALEMMIEAKPYCFGETPTLADVCLVPQVYNARRFKVALDDFPKIVRAAEAAGDHPAFAAARPEAQPDFEG